MSALIPFLFSYVQQRMNTTHWTTFISFFNSSKIFYHIHEDETLNYTSVRFSSSFSIIVQSLTVGVKDGS